MHRNTSPGPGTARVFGETYWQWPATIRKAAQAVDNYLAIKDGDQSPRAIPVKSAEMLTQPPAWKAGQLVMAEVMTKHLQKDCQESGKWLVSPIKTAQTENREGLAQA